MAIGTTLDAKSRLLNNAMQNVVPVSQSADWVECCTAPEASDNSGSTVTAPLGITREDQHWVRVNGKGTKAQIRLKYDAGLTVSQNPVIQAFGRTRAYSDDGTTVTNENAPQRLFDAAGNHEITLTTASSTDVSDGTFKYAAAIEVDLTGNREFLVAVKTALNGTGTLTNSTIQVKVL